MSCTVYAHQPKEIFYCDFLCYINDYCNVYKFIIIIACSVLIGANPTPITLGLGGRYIIIMY